MIAVDAPDLDSLTQALREDGVVVDAALGSGEVQDSHDRLAALVREMSFPVYLALTETPKDVPAEDKSTINDVLAGSLHRRLGDGLYVVMTTDSSMAVYSWGLGANPSRLSLTAYANQDLLEAEIEDLSRNDIRLPPVVRAEGNVRSAEELVALAAGPSASDVDYPPSLTEAAAEELAARAIRLEASAQWRPEVKQFMKVRTTSQGRSALLGILTALVVGLLLGQSLWGWPRFGPRRTTRRAAGADLAVERAEAIRLADRLTAELVATDWKSAVDRDLADRSLTARDVLESLLASEDVADLVGAQVVARTGSSDLRRGVRGRGSALRVCFFDPRHSLVTESVSWRLGAGEVEVSCCQRCQSAVSSLRDPEMLLLPTNRGARPYWERDDVWAQTGFGSLTETLAGDVLAARGERR